MVLTRINTISATTLLIPLLLTGFKGDIIDYEDDTEDFISSFVESDEKSTIFFIEDLTKSRVDINPLIKGGEETAIEIYPFVVSIQYRGNHKCGGVIIERNVVLTAAHCIAANIKGWEVLAGTTDLLNNEKGQRLKVESSLKHPDHVHNSTVLLNDIGLIWLNDCLTWSDSIKPAKLSQTWPLNLRPVKARLYVATTIGWGRQSNDSGVHSAVLRRVEQPLTPEEVCLNSLKTEEVKDAYVSQMFCFDDMGTGSCEGDSGGPVVFNNEIIGIVSHSIGQRSCKASVKWKVKISPYYTWIKELMDKGYKCSISIAYFL